MPIIRPRELLKFRINIPHTTYYISGIFAYVILKDGIETDHAVLRQEMSDMISTRIGKFAKPEAIVVKFTLLI